MKFKLKRTRASLRKRRLPKSILYAFAGTVGLTVFFVGAGVAYVYFGGSKDILGSTEEIATGALISEPSFETDEPLPGTKVGVSVQSLTSPVAPGENATFQVRTLRDSECEITVEYDGIASQDSGLIAKTADRFGMASWTWTVEEYVPLGAWPIEVVCSWYEESGMVRADLTVGYEAETQ